MKHDAKSRKKGDRFVKLEHWILKTEAWLSLKPRERVLFLLLLERYNGSNNGRISLSIREASRLCNIAQGTATKAFFVLIDKGFIRRRFEGSFSQKIMYASEYEITIYAYLDKSPTKDFTKWKPELIPISNEVTIGVNLGELSNDQVI